MQIFQGSSFRNLLHIELFFRKANDEDARAWIARKQVIAWGIINELSAEIERLEAINYGDCDELQELKLLLERTRSTHETVLSQTVEAHKKEMQAQQESATETLESVKSEYEARISRMENDEIMKMGKAQEEL